MKDFFKSISIDEGFLAVADQLNVPLFIGLHSLYKSYNLTKVSSVTSYSISKDTLFHVSPDGNFTCKFSRLDGVYLCTVLDNSLSVKFERKLYCSSINYVRWSPNSKSFIFFEKNEKNNKIFVINLEKCTLNLLAEETDADRCLFCWYNTYGTKILVLNYLDYKTLRFDSKWLIYRLMNNDVETINFPMSECLIRFIGLNQTTVFNNEFNRLILHELVNNESKAIVFDIKNKKKKFLGEKLLVQPNEFGPSHPDLYLWSPANRVIVFNILESGLSVYDAVDGKWIGYLFHDEKFVIKNYTYDINYNSTNKCITPVPWVNYLVHAFSKDGEKLITISENSTLYVWLLKDCICIKKVKLLNLNVTQEVTIEHVSYEESAINEKLTIILFQDNSYQKLEYNL